MKSVWPILEQYVNEGGQWEPLNLQGVTDESHLDELLQELDGLRDELVGMIEQMKKAVMKRDGAKVAQYLSWIDGEARRKYMEFKHLIGQEEKDNVMNVYKPSDLWTGMKHNTPFGKRPPPPPAEDEE